MNRFITTVRNIFSIEELRNRIFYTLFFLLIFRLASFVVLPGVDPFKLADTDSGGILGLINTILGGAFNRASIVALGIMPYISASIVVQLLTLAVPSFQRMQKEGESGRRKINQITRVLTIAICLAQSAGYLYSQVIIKEGALLVQDERFFIFYSTVILTAGTMFTMWLGEKITEKGIGNGTSMIIMIGIISELPKSLWQEFISRNDAGGLIFFILELLALYFVIMGTILLVQAVRRIPIQYANQVAAGAASGRRSLPTKTQRSYLPLKVNAANVMPIIFAQSLMFLPALVFSPLREYSDFAASMADQFSNFTSLTYNLTFSILIITFTFFYTAIIINPRQIAEDLKRNNAFISGVKPGEATEHYISRVIDLITLPGAVFLAVIAILPTLAVLVGVSQGFAQFYGGTSLIIIVGVVLDTLQQIESYLLNKHYDGMLQTGHVKGRASSVPSFYTQSDI
jgi:preprotein translocase subunit SecY